MKILFVTLGNPSNETRNPIVQQLIGAGYACQQMTLPYGRRVKRFFQSLWQARQVGKFDVVITNEYNNAFVFILISKLFLKRCKHIVIGMNLSGLPLKTGIGLFDRIIDSIFQKLDLVIVHSRAEIDLFVNLHGIARDKFRFSSWGFDAPAKVGPTKDFHAGSAPYFCMIGRNNRDFATFIEALAISGAEGVIVCDDQAGIDIPAGVKVRLFSDLSMEECASCVYYSKANVILVNNAERGAGHITAVMGMLYGKPHIFTNVPTLEDYLVADRHGVGVRCGDAAGVAAAMSALASDPDLAARLGAAGKKDAEAFHSHKAALQRVCNFVIGEIGRP